MTTNRVDLRTTALLAAAEDRKHNLNMLDMEGSGVLRDPIKVGETGYNVSCYFRNIEDALVANIEQADAIVGCVAWLTSGRVIDALAEREVSIVVQKEDFLRPEAGAEDGWKRWLRDKYESATHRMSRFDVTFSTSGLGGYSTLTDDSIECIRCLGSRNTKGGKDSKPLMHHKFMVFLSSRPERRVQYENDEIPDVPLTPYAVWTGSLNPTKNGSKSLENAVVISSGDRTKPCSVAWAYLFEWAQVVANSEPLDWEHEYVAPQWRLGT